jgi:hypothetical protein
MKTLSTTLPLALHVAAVIGFAAWILQLYR